MGYSKKYIRMTGEESGVSMSFFDAKSCEGGPEII